MRLTNVSNDELLAGLKNLVGEGNRIVAKTIAYLVEVEDRRLHVDLACSSMFDFCRRKLGLSEGEAFRRLTAARLVRRFPQLLEIIASGRLTLSTAVRLRSLFTEENFDGLVDAAAGKTKDEVEELVAKLAPKPDVAPSIRKLPEKAPVPQPSATPLLLMTNAKSAAPSSTRKSTPPAQQVQPLSESRYKVQLTASGALRDKLEHARSLMRHQNPTGDLAVVVERALDLLIADLEKKKLGKTERPRRPRASAKAPADPAYVTRAARREVSERDALQCSFVSADGERCLARDFLELDHRNPRARGGTGAAANLRWLGRAHNKRAAELVFGRDHVESRIHFRQHKAQCVMTGSTSKNATERMASAPTNERTMESSTSKERVHTALRSLGFRNPDADRGVAALDPAGWDRPIELLLREAIRAVT